MPLGAWPQLSGATILPAVRMPAQGYPGYRQTHCLPPGPRSKATFLIFWKSLLPKPPSLERMFGEAGRGLWAKELGVKRRGGNSTVEGAGRLRAWGANTEYWCSPSSPPPTLKGMSGVTLSQDEARGGQRPRGRQARGGGTTGKP